MGSVGNGSLFRSDSFSLVLKPSILSYYQNFMLCGGVFNVTGYEAKIREQVKIEFLNETDRHAL